MIARREVMTVLERNPLVAAIPLDMVPIKEGFERGKYYEQVDLGSRAAVEGLASVLRQEDTSPWVSIPILRIANKIIEVNSQSPGEYVVYTGKDQFEDEIAYAYQRVDA